MKDEAYEGVARIEVLAQLEFQEFLVDRDVSKTCYDRRPVENSPNLMGQIVCLPGGVKVKVESVEGDPPRAVARRVDGPLAGNIAICDVSKLQPLESKSKDTQERRQID